MVRRSVLVSLTSLVFRVAGIRFLYDDLEPMAKFDIRPDPHPEGPSSLPLEVPLDVRKELARERQREGQRKVALNKQLPCLTEVRT